MLDVLCGIYKNWTFWTKSRLFLSPAWPDLWLGMANVCYCHEFNDMLNM